MVLLGWGLTVCLLHPERKCASECTRQGPMGAPPWGAEGSGKANNTARTAQGHSQGGAMCWLEHCLGGGKKSIKKARMEGGRIVKEGNVQGVSFTENKSNPSKGSHPKLCLICGVVGCAQSALARKMGKVGSLACALAHSLPPHPHVQKEAGADPQ